MPGRTSSFAGPAQHPRDVQQAGARVGQVQRGMRSNCRRGAGAGPRTTAGEPQREAERRLKANRGQSCVFSKDSCPASRHSRQTWTAMLQGRSTLRQAGWEKGMRCMHAHPGLALRRHTRQGAGRGGPPPEQQLLRGQVRPEQFGTQHEESIGASSRAPAGEGLFSSLAPTYDAWPASAQRARVGPGSPATLLCPVLRPVMPHSWALCRSQAARIRAMEEVT